MKINPRDLFKVSGYYFTFVGVFSVEKYHLDLEVRRALFLETRLMLNVDKSEIIADKPLETPHIRTGRQGSPEKTNVSYMCQHTDRIRNHYL